MISEATSIIGSGRSLKPQQMQAVMEEIMTASASTEEIVDFLKAMNKKGETAEEVAAAVTVMRQHASCISVDRPVVLDTCGTGGDRKGTFNISTVVAFVASACGITVAKHGNRSVSSKSGSADCLEALGININLDAAAMKRCLENTGLAFLFAPNCHPAMKYAAPARKAIGERTIFNILGPLSNPAGATHQLIGVYELRWSRLLAEALLNLGSKHVLVVHGLDGLDEITTCGPTQICEAYQGKVNCYQVAPGDFGIPLGRPEDLNGGDAQDNAAIALEILGGKKGPKRDIVLLNTAAALYAAEKVHSIAEGIPLAEEAIDSGRASEKLKQLKECSR